MRAWSCSGATASEEDAADGDASGVENSFACVDILTELAGDRIRRLDERRTGMTADRVGVPSPSAALVASGTSELESPNVASEGGCEGMVLAVSVVTAVFESFKEAVSLFGVDRGVLTGVMRSACCPVSVIKFT